MFESIIHRAQSGISKTVDQMLGKVAAVVPFAIAFGFAVAALTSWLYRELGTEAGNLVMAVIFTIIGVVVYAYIADGPESFAAGEDVAQGAAPAVYAEAQSSSWSDTEKEVAAAVLSAVAPAAAPLILKLVLRNLPLVLAILAAIFVMTRQTATAPAAAVEPAAEA